MPKKSHTCEEGGAHLRIFLWHLLINFEKPEKSEFWKNEKKKKEKKNAGNIIILHMFTKNHNILGHSSYGDGIIYTCATKNTIIWCMLTQIWSATYIIFCHFRPIFALLHHYWPKKWKFRKNVKNTWGYYPFTHVYHKSKSCDVWLLRYKVQWTEFFYILGHFLHFDPPNNPENQSFEKLKKMSGDIFILHLRTANDDHMMYGSSDIKHGRQNVLLFWAIFCLFIPLTTRKIKILKKRKKFLEILSF